MSKICFITAIYGGCEKSCKKFIKQTIETDFICFTNDKNIINNGWTIDTTPYHIINKSYLDNNTYTNSFCNNKHTFNIAKYYKQSFNSIPILQKYDVVVWVDGTVEIIYEKTSEYILSKIYTEKIIAWHHDLREGILINEVNATRNETDRYTTTYWFDQHQPYQDIYYQFYKYMEDGYSDLYFKRMKPESQQFGLWITCFVAFLRNDTEVRNFLDLWYLQTLVFTTQDQISFPYVCQKTNLIPYTLPDNEIYGYPTYANTMFYIRHKHGF